MLALRQYFDDSYRVSRLIGASWSTVDTYRACINRFAESLGHNPTIDDLSDRALAHHVDFVIAKGRAQSTAIKHMRHLLSIWKFACDVGTVTTKPTVKPPKPIKRLPQAWDPTEIGRIIESSKLEPGMVGEVPAPLFWPALINFTYDVGSRKSVTLRLAMHDIDRSRRLVRLPAHLQKTKVEQVLMFSQRTLESLEAIWEPDDREFLFCWPHDRYQRSTWTAFNRRLKRIIERAGLDTSQGMMQRIRRTCATQFEILQPGSATTRLGHSSPAVTKGHYIDWSRIPASDTVDRIADPTIPTAFRVVG